jgi:hypothetical protein
LTLAAGVVAVLALAAWPPGRSALGSALGQMKDLRSAVASFRPFQETFERERPAQTAAPADDWARQPFAVSLPDRPVSNAPSAAAPAPLPKAEPLAKRQSGPLQRRRAGTQPIAPSNAEPAPAATEQVPAAATDNAPVAAAGEVAPEAKVTATPFDRAEATKSIGAIVARLGECADESVGHVTTRAQITFAPSGRATQATVDALPAMVGSPMTGCIVQRLRQASVPPFDGEMVTVRTTITVE